MTAHDDTAEARSAQGQFVRTPDTVARDLEALRLRGRGHTYSQIAETMGYADQSGAHKAVQRGMTAGLEEPAADVRKLELERLDAMQVAVNKVLEGRHVTVSQGRIVYTKDADGEEGEPLRDDAPVLAAVDRLLKIATRRAALLGLDAPTRADISGDLTYQVVGVPTEQLGGAAATDNDDEGA